MAAAVSAEVKAPAAARKRHGSALLDLPSRWFGGRRSSIFIVQVETVLRSPQGGGGLTGHGDHLGGEGGVVATSSPDQLQALIRRMAAETDVKSKQDQAELADWDLRLLRDRWQV